MLTCQESLKHIHFSCHCASAVSGGVLLGQLSCHQTGVIAIIQHVLQQ